MPDPFYWRNARDSLITPVAVQLFQIVAKHEGEDFDVAKAAIDSEYATIRGHESERHGGKIQTAINVYREAGWVDLSPDENGKHHIRITPAGRQALLLLGKLPDFLKAVPYFVVELLSRYQLNNPARPDSRDAEYDNQIRESDIFPYWTLFRVMRDCENCITSDELKRFVFQIRRKEDIAGVVEKVKEYRKDKEAGLSQDDLDRKYPAALEGAVAEPKYLMGRLGTQVGSEPPVVRKDAMDRWVLEDAYVPFMDEVIKDEPTFKDYLDERAWMRVFGRPVALLDLAEDVDSGEIPEENLTLDDSDPVWLRTKALLDAGSLTVILTGPPGTSKTWYARRIARRVAGSSPRVRQLQFHPSFGYDDFVEGYVPVSPRGGASNRALFQIVPKIFTSFCDRARQNPEEKFVLVIDEINRGDISRIFGELLTYLEAEYRGKPFTLAYSGQRTTIPANVVVIGTMNPYDRSITELDDALERRFDRIALNPDVSILKKLMNGAEKSLVEKVAHFFEQVNEIAPHGFGHTFFNGVKSEADLVRVWNHNLRFVFERMFRFDMEKFKDVRTAFVAILSDDSNLA